MKTRTLLLIVLLLSLPLIARAAVSLKYFRVAGVTTTQVKLEWETSAEPNHQMFVLSRSESETGGFLTLETFPRQGDAATGATYSYTDTLVSPGMTYWYKLEDMDNENNLHLAHPVITVDVPIQDQPTATPTATDTPTPTAESNLTPTPTPYGDSPLPTPTPYGDSPLPTPTPAPTATDTPATTPTNTPTSTSTPTTPATNTPTSTPIPTTTFTPAITNPPPTQPPPTPAATPGAPPVPAEPTTPPPAPTQALNLPAEPPNTIAPPAVTPTSAPTQLTPTLYRFPTPVSRPSPPPQDASPNTLLYVGIAALGIAITLGLAAYRISR